MQVHKFGGKSLGSAEGFKRVGEIIKGFPEGKHLIVVSAVAGITRLLDQMYQAVENGNLSDALVFLEKFRAVHVEIILEIIPKWIREEVLESFMRQYKSLGYTLTEDKPSLAMRATVLSYGETASSMIMTGYLQRGVFSKAKVTHASALSMIKTKGSLVEATVARESQLRVVDSLNYFFKNHNLVVTEGFIGHDHKTLKISLLGFEGSDTSAAWFANFLNADQLTFWKDVRGVLKDNSSINPDSEVFKTMTFEQLEYHLSHGCTVIHPNAVIPLKEQRIVTVIRSFSDLDNPGTIVS